jgi:hypothetical protein
MRYARSLVWYSALLCIAGAIGVNAYIDSCNALVGIKTGLLAFGIGCVFSLAGNFVYNRLS